MALKVKPMVLVAPWKESGAAFGRVVVTFRLSVLPLVRAVKLDRVRLVPAMGPAKTVVLVAGEGQV